MTDQTEVFEEHRPLLLGLGYRLLGSMWDAEDVVQEAYLRWTGTDTTQIREPRAFLITVVSRLALDQLRSARLTREAYVGPWLPEPVSAAGLGPVDTAELRDTLSYATLHMMERLTPPERAVFVLREAFELPYDEIARVIDLPVASCRQHHRRAARKLAGGRDRFQPSGTSHAKLVARFLDAAQGGDLATLADLLAEDVTAWNDGGGRVRAALNPIVGIHNVLAFIGGLMSRYPLGEVHAIEANGGHRTPARGRADRAVRRGQGAGDRTVCGEVRRTRLRGAGVRPPQLGRERGRAEPARGRHRQGRRPA